MLAFGKITGRYYQPFEYYGHPNAEQIIILMGSAAGPCEEHGYDLAYSLMSKPNNSQLLDFGRYIVLIHSVVRQKKRH